MANSLNRDIEAGEVLVIKKSRVAPLYADVNRRLFVARAGFGMKAPTAGGSIMGEEYSRVDSRYVRDGRGKWHGFDISKSETEEWQAAHGKFLPAETAARVS